MFRASRQALRGLGKGAASRMSAAATDGKPALRRSVEIDWPGLRTSRAASAPSSTSGRKSMASVAPPLVAIDSRKAADRP